LKPCCAKHQHWQETAPQSSVRQHAAVLPGYLEPLEWLQVLIPHAYAAGERAAAAAGFCRCAVLRNGAGSPPARESMLADCCCWMLFAGDEA
jgi:uncharacterized protein YqcC (DUF446 family)